MTTCPKCGSQIESPFDGKHVIHDVDKCAGLVNRPSDKPMKINPEWLEAPYEEEIIWHGKQPKGLDAYPMRFKSLRDALEFQRTKDTKFCVPKWIEE